MYYLFIYKSSDIKLNDNFIIKKSLLLTKICSFKSKY